MFSGFYLLTNEARQLYSVQHIFIEQIFLNYSFFKNTTGVQMMFMQYYEKIPIFFF